MNDDVCADIPAPPYSGAAFVVCTRPRGHDGAHIATGSDGRTVAAWAAERPQAARKEAP